MFNEDAVTHDGTETWGIIQGLLSIGKRLKLLLVIMKFHYKKAIEESIPHLFTELK